ncbi:MAG TPA: hypothetical protein VIH57_02300 [Bacteroidales bacterium]
MRNNSIFFTVAAGMLLFAGCEDLEQTDISQVHVQLNAPSNKLVTNLTTLTFWWDSISGAQSYNLQIVSKSFTQIEQVLLDTVVKKNKIRKNLNLGKYEWRVSAINGSNRAYSDTFSFAIDTAKSALNNRALLKSISEANF